MGETLLIDGLTSGVENDFDEGIRPEFEVFGVAGVSPGPISGLIATPIAEGSTGSTSLTDGRSFAALYESRVDAS